MKIPTAQLLFSQGFGTRRECDALIRRGSFSIDGGRVRDVDALVETEGLRFEVDGEHWPFVEKAVLALHKPTGYECSAKPHHWPSVYELLPTPLRNRPVKGGQNGVQAVGRLDQDTTGLLLLSDDGQFIHRMNSPKHHVPKIYAVTTDAPITGAQCAALSTGVVLKDAPAPVRAHACEIISTHALQLTLTEGKYHQVKRMIAAVGNHVTALHRVQIGGYALPPDLLLGQWRWLSAEDLRALTTT